MPVVDNAGINDIILDIDRANLTEDNHIETKYGIGLLRNLSSGCKSYLNVIFNPDKIVSAMECGANYKGESICRQLH